MDKETTRLVIAALFIALALCWGVFLWPSIYCYKQVGQGGITVIVRIHRLTGEADVVWPPAHEKRPR